MSALLELMTVMIAHVLSVSIQRVASNVNVSLAILEMENLATFLVRNDAWCKSYDHIRKKFSS